MVCCIFYKEIVNSFHKTCTNWECGVTFDLILKGDHVRDLPDDKIQNDNFE